LIASRSLASVAWGASIEAAHAKGQLNLADEPTVRRIQFGWTE
jgi:hypothetical protein